MNLTERQRNMLSDIARFDYAKYRYRAMPADEIAIRDSRVMVSLLRKGLVEYPTYEGNDGMPCCEFDCIRITDVGRNTLKG